MMLRATFASLLACTFLATTAFAQTGAIDGALGELVTDRPDFTESSEVVGRGVLVLETGFTLEGDHSDDVLFRSISTPAVLARIGLNSRVELRLGGEGKEVDAAVSNIIASIGKVKTLVEEVSAASAEQAQGIVQVTQAISQMESVTQTTAATAEESAASSEELNAEAETAIGVVRQLETLVTGATDASVPMSARTVSAPAVVSRARNVLQMPRKTSAPRQVTVSRAEEEFPLGDTGTYGSF